MTPSAYITHRRSLFYPKTDDLNYETRQLVHLTMGENTLCRYSMIENDCSMIAEARVADEARRIGLPVPSMQVILEPKQTCLKSPVVKGITLTNLSQIEKNAVYADLGRLLAMLHIVRVNRFGYINPSYPQLRGIHETWMDHILTRFEDHNNYALLSQLIDGAEHHWIQHAIIKFCERKLRKTIWWRGQTSYLLHGDLSDRNILAYQSAVSAILDWEDAIGGDPVFDLAYWATFHPKEVWPNLLDSYFIHTDKPDDFDERFWAYYLRISLSKLVQNHKKGLPDLTKSIDRVQMALTQQAL